MAKNPNSAVLVRQLVDAFMRLPLKARIAIGVLCLLVGVIYYALYQIAARSGTADSLPDAVGPAGPVVADETLPLVNVQPAPVAFPPGSRTVEFCVWNMENLFDDRDDKRRTVDEEYDNWFARNAEDRRRKYEKLAGWLLKQNEGRGPDVIVGIEIESYRAAQLLQEQLNAGLPASADRYEHVVMKELDAGRYIAPCVISRYPLSGAALHGRLLRILEVRVTVNGHDLTVIASHWTSQLSDDGSKQSSGRNRYATVIADLYRSAIRANPKVDFLVCGDFNDTPESEPVLNKLRMIGDARRVTADADPPRLFGLLSGKDPAEYGTHFYNRPLIYDQIGISPGLLDNHGWGYVPDSVRVPTDGLVRFGSRGRRPWRYGSERDDALGRGFSDHFPVLATFRVSP